LRADAFATASWCRGDASPLDLLLVANPPLLTEYERKLVQAVERDDFPSHVLAEPEAAPAAVATVVATWAANKALDAAWDKTAREAREYARQHERQVAENRRDARQRQLEYARANRTRHRNAEATPMPEEIVPELIEGLDPAESVQELLALRRRLLGNVDA